MKTQSQINSRLKAYKNKSVNSPYRVSSLTYREQGYLPMQSGAIDVDKRFNAQCMDIILDYVLWYTDNKVRLWGNARDVVDNNLKPFFTWHDNTPGYVPPKGAIGVATFGTPGFIEYGHIWLVYDKANKNTMRVIEQNWNNQANLPPLLRTDNYYGCAGFWVPSVKQNAVKKAVKKATATVKAPAKKVAAKKITWNWKGRFTPNATIKVRRSAGLNGAIVDKGSWLYGANDWVDFVSITKKDGYWWVKFKYPTNPKAGYFYCAITKITDKKERIKYEKDMFGKVAWK